MDALKTRENLSVKVLLSAFWPEKCLVKHHFPPFLQFRLFSSETQSNRDRVIDPTFTGYLTVQK